MTWPEQRLYQQVRHDELMRRVRNRREQERAIARRGYRLVYEKTPPLTRDWAKHDLDCEGL